MDKVIAHIIITECKNTEETKDRLQALIEQHFPGPKIIDIYTTEERYGTSNRDPVPDGPIDGPDEPDDSIDFPLGLGGVL